MFFVYNDSWATPRLISMYRLQAGFSLTDSFTEFEMYCPAV
jgi:hypothetical protein